HNFFRKPAAVRHLTKKIYAEAKAFITVSNFLADEVKAVVGRGADALIPNVVDTTQFFQKPEKYSKFSFIHVSNMVPLKNVGSILEAFKQLLEVSGRADLQLILAGNRDQHYPRMAAAMGLLNRSVFFRGEISYPEVADEMKRCHTMILFSDSETFSCVTAEALCAGLPVIASETGALSELINESNGILVPAGDRQALVAAMGRMLDLYPAFDTPAISKAASNRYGYARVAEDFDRLYRAYC
ncbi:MAG TPA: glycosyltransferase, partial [Flavisolibacter sp.]|nr:glycosyltransferase [Flavisolibacter sp.]